MSRLLGILLLLSLLLVSGGATDAQLADAPWPMFRHDTQHTGRSPFTGPQVPNKKWIFTTEAGVTSSPAISPEGTVYVGSLDHKLCAINPDGSLEWSFTTEGPIGSTAALGADGTVYVGSGDGNLYAVKPDGTLKWSFLTGDRVDSSPAIDPDGTIYVGSHDGHLYAVNSEGTPRWNVLVNGLIDSSPAIGVDGTVYVGSQSGQIYAISESEIAFSPASLQATLEPNQSVTQNLKISNLAKVSRTLSIAEDQPVDWLSGTFIFITAGDSHNVQVFFNSTGLIQGAYTNILTIASDDPAQAQAQIDVILCVITCVGDTPWPVFRHDPQHTGRSSYKGPDIPVKKWKFNTGADLKSSPAIGDDGTIYVGSRDEHLYAVNPEGTLK